MNFDFFNLFSSSWDFGFSFNSFVISDILFYLSSICFGILVFVFFFLFFSLSCDWVSLINPNLSISFKFNGILFCFNLFDYLMVFFPFGFCYFSMSCCVSLIHYSEGFGGVFVLVQVIAYQWGWKFIYGSSEYDSLMLSNSNYFSFGKGLPLVLPFGLSCVLVLSSLDVIHSLGCDTLGFKLDAVPGHSSSVMCLSSCPGFSYVYCSEFCGLNHSFMGFFMDFISFSDFDFFVKALKG